MSQKCSGPGYIFPPWSETLGQYYAPLAPKSPWECCCNKTSEEERGVGRGRLRDGIQNNALKAHTEIKTSIVRLLYGASVGYSEKRRDILNTQG